MLPKKKRMTKSDFATRGHFSTLRGNYIDIKILQGEELKVAVVVGKSITTKAVVRNELRRKVYEAIKKETKAQGKYILFPKKVAISATLAELEKDIHSTLKNTHYV